MNWHLPEPSSKLLAVVVIVLREGGRFGRRRRRRLGAFDDGGAEDGSRVVGIKWREVWRGRATSGAISSHLAGEPSLWRRGPRNGIEVESWLVHQTGVDSSRQGHQGLDLLELGHRWRLETGRRMKRESLLFYTQSPFWVTILKHKLCSSRINRKVSHCGETMTGFLGRLAAKIYSLSRKLSAWQASLQLKGLRNPQIDPGIHLGFRL